MIRSGLVYIQLMTESHFDILSFYFHVSMNSIKTEALHFLNVIERIFNQP